MNRTSRYQDSIRSRISLTYTLIYLVNCLVVIIVFVAGYSLYKISPYRKRTADIAREVLDAVIEEGRNFPNPDRENIFRVDRLYPIVDMHGAAAIFVYDANIDAVPLARSNVTVDNEPYMTRKNNILYRLVPQLTRILDKPPYYIDEEEKTYETLNIRVIVYYDATSGMNDLFMMTRIVGITMLIGLYLFSIIGRSRTQTMLEPIARISNVAKRINGENLSLRIDEKASKFELNELVKTINRMMDRIQASYNNQKRFVSDVSHELRTPISVISGYANMLKRWGKEKEDILDESIEAIIDEADMMNDLVEKLLFLARHDNETLRFEFGEADISKILLDSAKETLLVHEEFIFELDIGENLIADVDPQRIKQLFRIFIDNSVKYSDVEKHVNISLRQEENLLFFLIKDRGIGISKEDLPRIFDRFYRAEESRARTTGGYGLGLPMAEIIVKGHMGSITVRSKLNRGTEFIIRLPIHQKKTANA